MAISQEALSSPAVVLTPNTAAMQYSKVARLEHFVGRRSPEYRHRADPGPFDPHRLNEEFDELTIRFEPEQSALWCMVNHHRAPVLHARLLDQIRDAADAAQARLARHRLSDDMPLRTHGLGLELPRDLEPGRRSRVVHQADPRRCRRGTAQLRVRLCRCGVPEPDQDGAAPVDHRTGPGRRAGRRVRAVR